MATLAISSSCTKKLDEAYTNPNAPVIIPPAELLAPITYQMALNLQDDYRYIGEYAQVFGYRNTWAAGSTDAFTYFDKMGYRPGVDNSGAIWRMHYFNIGQNLNKLIEFATEKNQWDYVGASYAIRAWSWLTLTDYHGEVILKEAFNTSQLAFKYDTQEDVYAEVRRLCVLALDNLNKTTTGSDFAIGDAYLNGGDKEKWKKFVYGVLARSYNHLSNKASYKPDSVIFYCDKAMQTNAENVTYKFLGNTTNNQNNYYGSFRGNVASFRQSRYIADLMQDTTTFSIFKGVDDPRKWYMLMPSPDGNINGLTPTLGQGVLGVNQRPRNFWGLADASIPTIDTGRFLFRNNAEYPLMTSAEIQFMKAEAAFKNGDKTTALAAYTKGISEHFDMLTSKYNVNIPVGKDLTANPSIKTAFLANPLVVPSAANLTISHIMQQKFIALWGHGVLEVWTDLRRYHYDVDKDPATGLSVYFPFTPPSSLQLYSDNSGKIAYRVRPRYNSEYVWNIANIAVYGGDKPDYHTYEMWFSKN
jgi:Starch-binding associating with outer membrane